MQGSRGTWRGARGTDGDPCSNLIPRAFPPPVLFPGIGRGRRKPHPRICRSGEPVWVHTATRCQVKSSWPPHRSEGRTRGPAHTRLEGPAPCGRDHYASTAAHSLSAPGPWLQNAFSLRSGRPTHSSNSTSTEPLLRVRHCCRKQRRKQRSLPLWRLRSSTRTSMLV